MIGYADPDGPNEMNANNNWWNCNTLPTDTPTPPCMGFGIAPGSTPIDVTPWSTTPYFTEPLRRDHWLRRRQLLSDRGAPCATVQRAVTSAYPGDTIQIAAGSYPETNITVNKQLDFVGESEAGAQVGPPVRQRGPARVRAARTGPTEPTFLDDDRRRTAERRKRWTSSTKAGATDVDDVAIDRTVSRLRPRSGLPGRHRDHGPG